MIERFKSGENIIEIKKMGREDGEIWFSDKDFSGISVLLLSGPMVEALTFMVWIIPVYVESSPEIARKRRIRRGRTKTQPVLLLIW